MWKWTQRRLVRLRGEFAHGGVRGLVALLAKNPPWCWGRPSYWRRLLHDDHFLGRLVEWRGDRVRVDGCRFSVAHPSIPTVRKALFVGDRYEIEERRALARWLDPTLPVVELGGSIGVVACITNRRLCDPDRHVVVEANPDLLPLLESNRRRNGGRFVVVHAALAYGAPRVCFQRGDFLDSAVQRDGGAPVEVPATDLRSVLQRFRIRRCTLVCDVEGAEVELVRHESDVLADVVATLVLEVHPWVRGRAAIAALFAALAKRGFVPVFRDQATWVLQNEALVAVAAADRIPDYTAAAAAAPVANASA